MLVTGSVPGKIVVRRMHDLSVVHRFPIDAAVECVVLIEPDNYVMVGLRDGKLLLLTHKSRWWQWWCDAIVRTPAHLKIIKIINYSIHLKCLPRRTMFLKKNLYWVEYVFGIFCWKKKKMRSMFLTFFTSKNQNETKRWKILWKWVLLVYQMLANRCFSVLSRNYKSIHKIFLFVQSILMKVSRTCFVNLDVCVYICIWNVFDFL